MVTRRLCLLSTLLLIAAAALGAQVRFNSTDMTISIGGQPFATFNRGIEAGKPFLAPLRSASGKIITRGFPMEMIPGESRDHLHHRGLWFSYDNVNGVRFWENDPSYTKPRLGRIIVRDVSWMDGEGKGTLTSTMEWCDPEGNVLLVEERKMDVYDNPTLRMMDFDITLTAAADVTIGDTKEGAFAIRLAENFTERRGVTIVNAEGLTGMKQAWGKRSPWVDYAADVDGELIGVAIFDHPQNPHYPTYWHVRDYGLFSLNPFGQAAFDPDADDNITRLSKGETLHFIWRVLIHPGNASSGHVAKLYQEFVEAQ